VFQDLKRIAHRRLASERTGHTLSTTALVHEGYLRMLVQRSVDWDDRVALFAEASRAMRRVLVDHARMHRTLRRGGSVRALPLDPLEVSPTGQCWPPELTVVDRAEELLDLDRALTSLAQVHERAARVVECRFFGGLTEAETAMALGVTERTVLRDWITSRLFLRRALGE
jgi:RNA polymerase sigma factor (TIGR02999 family)